MSFWMRSGTLQVGGNRYRLDDLVYEFEVPFEDSEQLMTAKIKIYNLSEGTRNSIQKNQPVIINAGYEGDIGVIFNGVVSEYKSSHQNLEWVTEIKATETMKEWLTSKVNKTYQEGTNAQTIVSDLLNIFSVEIAEMNLVVNKTYPRGRSCVGYVRDVLKEIVMSDCKSIFMVRHDQVYIRDPSKGAGMGVLLSPQTGLLNRNNENQEKTEITAPQETQIPQEQRAEGGKYFKRECLLCHRIAPGDIVQIQDSTLNGSFIIKKGGHKGSRKADWLTNIEVIPA